MERLGIVGHGRFGKALADLATDVALPTRAWDAHADVPSPRAASSLEELASTSDIVVIAVPVSAMPVTLRALRPHLRPEQLVLDVGSVKLGPIGAMREILGEEIPWIGTHPLFGPVSLALAERPLRVVLCPNDLHPAAPARARALYERLGCWTFEQDPAAHDRTMAETHALAFFVAKGFLDAGVDVRTPFAPPSFQSIARTVESVRGDAGHLFATIQAENTYASEARRRLLDALSALDATIASPPDRSRDEALAIPRPTAYSPELLEARDLIDAIDRQLVELLARRSEIARRTRLEKARLGKPVADPDREAQLLRDRRAWADALQLDAESIEDVFRAVLRFSRRAQQ